MHIRYLLLALATTLVAPSLITPSLAASAAPCRSATDTLCDAALRKVHDGDVLAQYITREEQQRRAQENLERHQRERNTPSQPVERSTGTATGETYGREWQERQIQGTDRPRVTRPW